MILKSELISIGKLYKPHGISGEITFAFTSEAFDRKESPYWVLEIDGILVPFFVESYRFKTNETALVKFEGIDSEKKAKELNNTEVYFPARLVDVEEEAESWNFYVGFNVYDEHAGYIGEVIEVDDSTINVLFTLSLNGKEILMPVAEEFFTEIDLENWEMHVNLPEGLLEL
jgi:16S rRNA processing protein RimM